MSDLRSNAVFGVNKTVIQCQVTVRWSGGDLTLYLGVSSDVDTPPGSWEEVTGLTSGVPRKHVFVNTGTYVWYRITKDVATTITGTRDVYGRFTNPAITIKNFEVTQ